MIARIEGVLDAMEEDGAQVRMPGGLTLEVLLPAFSSTRLGPLVGESITLHTILFLEGQAQGATMTPRLAGFTCPEDRAFYRLFTTCRGIGQRRALRAMTLATPQLAAAINDRDLATLQSLPEIGKRTAETIVATLRGKVDSFLTAAPATAGSFEAGEAVGVDSSGSGLAREALDVLTQLGENRTQAIAWIDDILARDLPPSDVQGVLQEVYRIKDGG